MPRSKPTPPTEPKQGSEERIEPVTELEAEKHTNKILRAELAAAREEIERCRLILEAGGRENGLRADLQLAREESARFSHHLREQMEATKAQFSRADRAEARVRELEDFILLRPPCKIACGHQDCDMARAILATRKKEESRG